jgi:hypothetical protein
VYILQSIPSQAAAIVIAARAERAPSESSLSLLIGFLRNAFDKSASYISRREVKVFEPFFANVLRKVSYNSFPHNE